jgi:hypothetical protein
MMVKYTNEFTSSYSVITISLLSESSSIDLGLGDIIQIIAPSNPAINEQIYLIIYIDEEKINRYDDFIEIYEFADAPDIEWFNGENFIRMYCMVDGNNQAYMDFEDDGEEDRDEVHYHLKEVWEQQLPDTEFYFDDDTLDEF